MNAPVVVIGGGLAGMAAAARLAKAGFGVELHERSDRLGGRWAAQVLPSGLLVDDAPAVLGFPAPWRDLFRKSGRPLEAELARSGYALVPADPATVVFADGSELRWPSDRGQQYAVLTTAYGRGVAERWRDLVDRLDLVWQRLRPLGWEAERPDARLTRELRRGLLGRQSVADLARTAGHPHLEALVRSVAHRLGGTPERTPAWAAVELTLQRTFGRWQLAPATGPEGEPGRSSRLAETLAARLDLRKVDVRLGSAVTAIRVTGGRCVAIGGPDGDRPARAVVSTVDPWTLVGTLLPRDAGRGMRRGVRALRPALAPSVQHQVSDEPAAGVTETVVLTESGVPTVAYARPVGPVTVTSRHDYAAAQARPAAGVGWAGLRSWLRRPPVTAGVPGLFLAGPSPPPGRADRRRFSPEHSRRTRSRGTPETGDFEQVFGYAAAMSTSDQDTIDVAAEKVYAAFDHLLRLVEEGRLDDLTVAQRRRYSTQLDQLQNRALFMERLVLAELARRRLPAAG